LLAAFFIQLSSFVGNFCFGSEELKESLYTYISSLSLKFSHIFLRSIVLRLINRLIIYHNFYRFWGISYCFKMPIYSI